MSFAASFEPFHFTSATLAWNDEVLVVQGIERAPRLYRAEGRSFDPDARRGDYAIPLGAITSITLAQPWPAIEIAWNDGVVARRLLAHPRGLSRLVPAADDARNAFEHFESLVQRLVADLERLSLRATIDRGWMDDPIVDWTRREALPGSRTRHEGYRDAMTIDALIAHAKVERTWLRRWRIAFRRWRGDHGDPLPIELAISEHEVWIVDDTQRVWAVPRRSLRAVYDDDDRIACIFGRCTFLAMSIKRSPIRAALLDVAQRAVSQNEALRQAA